MEDQTPQSNIHPAPGHSSGGKTWLWVLLVIVLITVAAGGVYYWQQSVAKKQKADLEAQINKLNSQIGELNKKLADAQKQKSEEKICQSLSKTQLDNVHAAIDSKNTAALEGYLASKVQYVLAASELGKDMTPMEVIEALDYLNAATSPWNWNITQATLNQYKAGDYKTYIEDDNIFGVSANKYFVSMRDNCGKIDQVFVSSSTDLL